MRIIHCGLFAAALIGSTLALGACSDRGRGYNSMSLGVSSYDGHGHRYRGGRDQDRDGVPNRYDIAPRNPYVN